MVREVLASRFLELRPASRPRTRWLAPTQAEQDRRAVAAAFDYQVPYVVRTIGSPKALPPR